MGGYVTPRLQPWDFAGGLIVLNEVGGLGTNLMGDTLSIYEPNSIVMANAQLHSELIEHHFQKNNEIIE
ncbi:inositol monophosphatase [Staphylococcus aureus]|nr:inositol monophosphatase [Staphylococcus aureus]